MKSVIGVRCYEMKGESEETNQVRTAKFGALMERPVFQSSVANIAKLEGFGASCCGE